MSDQLITGMNGKVCLGGAKVVLTWFNVDGEKLCHDFILNLL